MLSARHPYAQPAFAGCRSGNAVTDPSEAAVAFGRGNVQKLANVVALGAQITAQPDSIDATEVEGIVQSTEAALVRISSSFDKNTPYNIMHAESLV